MMTTENKHPTHSAFFIKNKGDTENQKWIKAGAAWSHADNEGMNLSLSILGQPVSLVIFKNKPKPE